VILVKESRLTQNWIRGLPGAVGDEAGFIPEKSGWSLFAAHFGRFFLVRRSWRGFWSSI
jgi:hypothetical protein